MVELDDHLDARAGTVRGQTSSGADRLPGPGPDTADDADDAEPADPASGVVGPAPATSAHARTAAARASTAARKMG